MSHLPSPSHPGGENKSTYEFRHCPRPVRALPYDADVAKSRS